MFFLARSALCIGLVAFLLPASQDPAPWQGLAASAGTAAAGQIEALCTISSSDCSEAKLARLVLSRTIGTGVPAIRRRSLDTLSPSDLLPAWNGPALRS